MESKKPKKKTTPKNEILLEALMAADGGRYELKSARNIIYGAGRMDSNERALRMEQNYGVSPYVWLKLYKKKKKEE